MLVIQSKPILQRKLLIIYYLPHCYEANCQAIKKSIGLLYPEIYDNIDLQFYSNEAWLKLFFICQPESNLANIGLNIRGNTHLIVDSSLVIFSIGENSIILPQPIAYEMDALNNLKMLPWRPTYYLSGSGVIRLKVNGDYNPNSVLIYQISSPLLNKTSPEQRNLEWSTPFGGDGLDELWDIDNDNSGNVFVTGYSSSTNFPITVGTSQSQKSGEDDIIVSKFDNNLKLDWSTFHGGSGSDGFFKHGITIDPNGNAYIAATTLSVDIPLVNKQGAYFDPQNIGATPIDLVISKYTPTGRLEWSTFFGGANNTFATQSDIFIDDEFYLYVTGVEGGNDNPRLNRPGSFYSGNTDGAFIARFDQSLKLDWCTGFGNLVIPSSIIKNNDGKLMLTGTSGNDPSFSRINRIGSYFQTNYGGGLIDGFISQFNSNLALEWSTYIGGDGADRFYRISADINRSDLETYIIGSTSSSNFPLPNNNAFFQPNYRGPFSNNGGDGDIVLMKFNSGGELTHASYYGDEKEDLGLAISVLNKQLFASGATYSELFPLLDASSQSPSLYFNDEFYNANTNGNMGYFLGFDKNLNRKWTTFYGGNAFQDGGKIHSIKCVRNYLYFVGVTQSGSPNFPEFNPVGSYKGTFSFYGGLIGRFNLQNTSLAAGRLIKEENIYQIFPNPVYDILSIDNPFNPAISGVVLDLQGKILINVELNGTTEINVQHLPASIYVLQITDKENSIYRFKFIKQ